MDNHRVAPPDLRGRPHPDRLFSAVGAIVTGYEWLASGGYRRRPATQQVDRDLNLVVDEVGVEAPDVRSFRLVTAGGAELPTWQPGCHLDVLLPSGRRRQYSLCGEPADRDSYRIAVRRIADGAGGSRELHGSVRTGSTLTVRGPRIPGRRCPSSTSSPRWTQPASGSGRTTSTASPPGPTCWSTPRPGPPCTAARPRP
ncbi:MAG: FAD-binding oxidoreductase [Pseudonocardiaceae bacterium]